jgi:hypothetical protein
MTAFVDQLIVLIVRAVYPTAISLTPQKFYYSRYVAFTSDATRPGFGRTWSSRGVNVDCLAAISA